MKNLEKSEYEHAFNRIKNRVENKFNIPVQLVKFTEDFSGDLNGSEIFINEDKAVDEQLFNLVHLFGHTVQWAVREDGYELGERLFHLPDENLLERLVEYEREAAQYSLALLIEAGGHNLIRWLSMYSDCDIRFLEHFYRTDEVLPFDAFRVPNIPRIHQIPIPPFTPLKRTGRTGGIVLSTNYAVTNNKK